MIRVNCFEPLVKMDCLTSGWRSHVEDLFFSPGSREIMFLKNLLERHSVLSVLDVACGNGDVALKLAKMGKSVTALDNDLARVKKVHLKSILAGVKLETLHGDMRDISSVYKQKCNLITCLRNALSRLLDEADIWGTLGQMYLALEPGGVLVIQNFDYDRLFRENVSNLGEVDEYFYKQGVNVFFDQGIAKSGAKFIFEPSEQYTGAKKPTRVVIPVRPVFKKELDIWLVEMGFKIIEDYGELTSGPLAGRAWHTVTAVYRPVPLA